MKTEMLILFAMCISAFAGEGGKVNVAVLPSEPGVFSSADLEYLGTQVESGILLSIDYRVVERAKMGSILAEHGFQNSGVCQQESCGVEMGKFLGVDKIVLLAVTREGGETALSAKLVNVQTGVIEKAESMRANGTLLEVASKKGLSLGCKLVGIVREDDKPVYQQKKLWISLGIVAVAIPVLFFATRSRTETETEDRQVRLR